MGGGPIGGPRQQALPWAQGQSSAPPWRPAAAAKPGVRGAPRPPLLACSSPCGCCSPTAPSKAPVPRPRRPARVDSNPPGRHRLVSLRVPASCDPRAQRAGWHRVGREREGEAKPGLPAALPPPQRPRPLPRGVGPCRRRAGCRIDGDRLTAPAPARPAGPAGPPRPQTSRHVAERRPPPPGEQEPRALVIVPGPCRPARAAARGLRARGSMKHGAMTWAPRAVRSKAGWGCRRRRRRRRRLSSPAPAAPTTGQ